MNKLILLASFILIGVLSCTNNENDDFLESPSFHVTCNLVNPQIEWHMVVTQFPENFRETTKEFVNERTVISKGYLQNHFFNQKAGSQYNNLLQFQVDLNNKSIRSEEIILGKNFSIPCTNCPTMVVDKSPNDGWVLAEIVGENHGLWLLGDGRSINILSTIPASYSWIWATDSNALWLSYNLDIIGRTFLIVNDIRDKPTVTEFEKLENFPPELVGSSDLVKYYFSTYSPDDKTIWWFQRFSEDIYIYDSIQQTYELQTIEDFLKVEWQHSLDTLMLVYFDGETLLMESQDGRYSVKIPREIAEKLYAPFSEERFFISNMLDYQTFLAPDGRYIFVGTNGIINKAQCEDSVTQVSVDR